MIHKVSEYYKILLNRLNHEESAAPHSLQQSTNASLISGKGLVVFVLQRHGFYGIIDEQNNSYYISNHQSCTSRLKDRQHVHFTLEILPEISNIARWGVTAKLHSII